MRRSFLLALVLAAAGCGRHAVDVPHLVATCGVDCAADELRLRLARSPRDRGLHAQLAALEDQRGRPGAALVQLDLVAALGRPFRAGLTAADRERLGRLLTRRANARAARGSPGADADVDRLRRLGLEVSPALATAAARAAILVELRHTDPDRRRRGALRLAAIDPALAVALTGAGDAADTERAAIWLDGGNARRVLHEMLDAYEERVHVAGFAAMARPAWMLDRWLAGRRWWHGDDGRPDLVTLGHALDAGADRCIFPRGLDARAACDRPLVETPSAAAPVGAPLPAAWSELAAELAAADPADRAGLAAIAGAFATDVALADRATDDFLAASLDVAAAAPAAARLFALLGDPARARALWQRAADADPLDPALVTGLAEAAADAGDDAAARQLAIDAAAASGDAGGTLLALARAMAVAGPPIAALSLARGALELAPPGDEGPAAALAAALLDRVERHDGATTLRAAARRPAAWDLNDDAAAVAGWRALAADPATRTAGLAGLVRLARDPDPARSRLAIAALRDLLPLVQ